MRRRTLGSKKLVDKEIRFTSSTSWTIPAGCKSIDIFLVGGGGAGGNWVTWGYTPGGPLVKVLEKVEDMAEEVAAPMELEEMEQC